MRAAKAPWNRRGSLIEVLEDRTLLSLPPNNVQDLTGLPISATQNVQLTQTVATFTDTDATATPSDFTATINWGDSSSTSAGTITENASDVFSVTGAHTYTSTTGPFDITVTIKDSNGTVYATNAFNQANLVSSVAGNAGVTDSNLINPWGMSSSSTSPIWVSDQGSGVTTLYNPNGSPIKQALTVTIPAVGTPSGPTGQVFNNDPTTTDFIVPTTTASAKFLFATLDGTIAAWNASLTPDTTAATAATVAGATFTGLAQASVTSGATTTYYLYATDFSGTTGANGIDVFDPTFTNVSATTFAGKFTDPNAIAGYEPFNIALLNGNLYVAYAQPSGIVTTGGGYIDEFDTSGNFINRIYTDTAGTNLIGPWGMAIAPSGFGAFGGDLLVGNFGNATAASGNGSITAITLPTTPGTPGTLAGTLTTPNGTIGNAGQWSLLFGNGGSGGTSGTLYVSAGIDGQTEGLLGSIAFSPDATASVAAAPLIAQGVTVTGTAGVPLTTAATGVLVATFMDTGTPGTDADYTATIDWGDGTAPTADTQITQQGTPNGVVFSVFGNHTYATTGTFPATVTIVKTASGATAIASAQAVIAATALTPGTATALSANTGTALPASSIIGTFTNVPTTEPASDFTATIDWGDGSPTSIGTVVAGTTAGTFDVEGTHAYAKFGTYTPTILITQAGGSPITLTSPATATITVTDPALTGTANAVSAVAGANTGTIVLATITDPNPLATASDLTATVNWGDGSGTVTVPVTLIGATASDTYFEVTGSHTYTTAVPSTHTVSTTVTTIGGATTTPSPLTATATVADAPITASGTSITGLEGISTGSVVIATFSDANPNATVADFTTAPGSIVVNWGDGSAPQTLTASNVTASGSPNGILFTVTAAHTYANVGVDQVTVTITDNGGATASANGTATIADAPLTAAATQPTISTTASAVFPIPQFAAPVFTGLVAAFTDADPTAPTSDYVVTIDWGDGTAQSAGTVTQPGGVGTTFDVTGSHTYADAGSTGTYPITVYIHDVDGSELTVHNTAAVANIPIVLTGSVNLATVSGQSTGTLDVTNNNQPDFTGTSQAFSWITLSATPTAGGASITLGTTQAQGNGAWNLASTVALPSNTYAITATAINQFNDASSTVSTAIAPALEIDTIAPVITGLSFDRFDSTMTVTFQDNLSGMDLASLENSAFYHLSGKRLVYDVPVPSLILPTSITVTPGATPTAPVVVNVVFHHGKTLRGGLYFIAIDSGSGNNGIEDNAENALSGTFYGSFPTGDGRPGGNFIASIETYHDVVKPLVPNGAGYVPPSAAVDPPAGTSKSSGHTHLKSAKHAKVTHSNASAKLIRQAAASSLTAAPTTPSTPPAYLSAQALAILDAAMNELQSHRSQQL